MKTISSSVSRTEQGNKLAFVRPVFLPLIFFIALVVLRSVEIFIPGLAALPDKTIASRILGFLMVLGYLWVS